MSHKIIKKGNFNISSIKKFDKELQNKQIGATESQKLEVPKFEMNKQHAKRVAVFNDSQLNVDIILKNAKKEAKDILDTARKEAEKTRSEAYGKGYKEGETKAASNGSAYVSDVVKNFSNLIKELSSYKEELLKETEEQILKLVIQAVNKVILIQIEENDEIIIRVVKESVKNLVDRESLTIKVNPSDAEVMKKEKVNIIQEIDGIKRLTIIEDESIKRGGCYIETISSDVDARIDKQVDIIKKALESN